MKKIIALLLIAGTFGASTVSAQEDKSKRPSPPHKVSQKLASGAEISVDYSRPSLKGRSLAQLAPAGKVWRTGANEATIFETNRDVTIEGQKLPAGKYSLYTIPGDNEWTIIFNKTWQQWGTQHKASDDVLRVKVKPGKAPSTTEQFTFNIQPNGRVAFAWADTQVGFNVK